MSIRCVPLVVALLAVACVQSSPGEVGAYTSAEPTDGGNTATRGEGSESTDEGLESMGDAGDGAGAESGTGEAEDEGATPIFDVGGDVEIPLLPSTCEEAADAKTSVGCTFFPALLPGDSRTAISVSNVSSDVATVKIEDSDGEVFAEVELAPGAVHLFDKKPVLNTDKLPNATTLARGIALKSDRPVLVYQYTPPNSQVTADASIVLPRAALGLKHRIATHNTHFNSQHQYLIVVATEDETQVSVTLTAEGAQSEPGNNPDLLPGLDVDSANDTLAVELDARRILMVRGHWENDTTQELNEFTGALVESDKPVAVYSGKILASLPEGECCGDAIATAIPPTATMGTRYAGVPFVPVGQPDKYDIWRVIGNADGTVVELSGALDDVIELDAGEFADIESASPFWAESNLPFGLVHMMTSGEFRTTSIQPHDCEGQLSNMGDPAMTWVYPAGNWLSRYLFPVDPIPDTQWCHDHATVVAPLAAWPEITLSGQPLPDPTPLGGNSGHGFAYVPLSEPSYELIAPANAAVEVTLHGFVGWGSYAFPGGMGLTTLNPEG